jgi:carboxymethylenebutenolidase
MGLAGEVTDLNRVEGSDVEFAGHDGDTIKGYLAHPVEAASQTPGLIVIHEAMGLNDHIRDVARRFANVGYTALAPDLYTREGEVPQDDFEEIKKVMHAMPDERIVGDLEGAASLLAEQPDASGRIGCVGFCAGGRQTLLFACNASSLAAAIDCWGGNVLRASAEEETTPQRPVLVVEMLDRLGCPLMLIGGAEDQNPSPADIETMSKRLEADGKEFTAEVCEDAGHAFFADYRPSYHEPSALRLWERMTEFFAEKLSP